MKTLDYQTLIAHYKEIIGPTKKIYYGASKYFPADAVRPYIVLIHAMTVTIFCHSEALPALLTAFPNAKSLTDLTFEEWEEMTEQMCDLQYSKK